MVNQYQTGDHLATQTKSTTHLNDEQKHRHGQQEQINKTEPQRINQ